MWQVYLFPAIERQAIEHREGVHRRVERGSPLRRWWNARRASGVQRVATQGR
jgi:hypothetical protein